MLSLSSGNIQEDAPDHIVSFEHQIFQHRLRSFIEYVDVLQLKTPVGGWVLPKSVLNSLNEDRSFDVIAIYSENKMSRIFIPQHVKEIIPLQNEIQEGGFTTKIGKLAIPSAENSNRTMTLKIDGEPIQNLSGRIPLIIPGNIVFHAELSQNSIPAATQGSDLRFSITLNIQETELKGKVPLGRLEIGLATIKTQFSEAPKYPPFWVYQETQKGSEEIHLFLPSDVSIGEGVILPKSFRDAGVLVGDRGYLSYFTPTVSTVQEQRIPIFVGGFYDPGIIPMGEYFVLVNKDLTTLVRSTYNQEDRSISNGINIRFDDIQQADQVKSEIITALKASDMDRYWNVETYREYDFAKEVIQQLHSEKRIFTLISIVIIIVACSNIL